MYQLVAPAVADDKAKGKFSVRLSLGAVNYRAKTFDNMQMLAGKDAMLKRLGNLSGGGFVDEIGTGDSTTAANDGQTDLQASTNKLWKVLTPATDLNYVRPTLFAQVTFGFSEANWTWNELGIRDNNNVMWARQVDGSPVVKTSSFAAIVEWQITL